MKTKIILIEVLIMILIIALSFVITYGLFVFFEMPWNIMTWSIKAKALYIVISMIIYVIVLCAIGSFLDSNSNDSMDSYRN